MTQPSVCLAVSSFRNDESVTRLLAIAAEPPARARFAQVLVIDSMGTGRVPELIERKGWKHVVYESAPTNIGSAGNFALRLQRAAELGCDYAFALNHDGKLDLTVVDRLLDFARQHPECGAVYPLRYLPSQKRYRIVSRARVPLPVNATRRPPPSTSVEVAWSSSNASLYSLEPVRGGLVPWADLWMGWEDLGYGRALERAGYTQFVLADATCDDDYEYRKRTVLGIPMYLTDKPSWYAYYHARNLLLVTRRTRRSRTEYVAVGARIVQEALVTAAFRPKKAERLRLLAEGIRDGLLDRSGKGPVP